MMEILHGVVLGAVQGLTEFFPVSSSGHLILVPAVLGWKDQGIAFDTVVHGGTLLAVLAAFRGELREIGTRALKKHAPTQQLVARIIVAAIPGLAIGFFAKDIIAQTVRGPIPVAISLALWAGVLWAADHWRATHHATTTKPHDVTWAQAIGVGLLQAVALIPGTSRSGITMTGGLFAGMDRATAVTFSFLISIPTIAAAFAYGIVQISQEGPGAGGVGMLVTGFVAAAVTGFWAIRFLRAYVSTHSFRPFVWYRFALAVLILFFLA